MSSDEHDDGRKTLVDVVPPGTPGPCVPEGKHRGAQLRSRFLVVEAERRVILSLYQFPHRFKNELSSSKAEEKDETISLVDSETHQDEACPHGRPTMEEGRQTTRGGPRDGNGRVPRPGGGGRRGRRL